MLVAAVWCHQCVRGVGLGVGWLGWPGSGGDDAEEEEAMKDDHSPVDCRAAADASLKQDLQAGVCCCCCCCCYFGGGLWLQRSGCCPHALCVDSAEQHPARCC